MQKDKKTQKKNKTKHYKSLSEFPQKIKSKITIAQSMHEFTTIQIRLLL